jgi:hypothetical protein
MVCEFRMEIVFTIMDVNSFQDKLYAETFRPDMLYNAFIK